MAARGPDDEAAFLSELRRRAQAGDRVARALLDAPRDPHPTTPEEDAALARAKAASKAGARTFTSEEILAMIEERRRSEEG